MNTARLTASVVEEQERSVEPPLYTKTAVLNTHTGLVPRGGRLLPLLR